MSKEDFQYKRSDSIIEPLRTLRSRVKKRDEQKHDQYMVKIMRTLFGSSLYLASLITRNEAISGKYDRYQISQRTSPVLEMRNYARVLWEYYNFLKKSKSVSIDKLPKIIERRIERQENKLERTLKERGIIDEKKGRIYYLIKDMMPLNGFYENLGGQIEMLLLEDPNVVKDYSYFTEKYEQIGTKGKKEGVEEAAERVEREVEHERVILVAGELERQEKLVREALNSLKSSRR